MASEATPFDTSVTFLFAPGCSTTFEGLPEGGGTLLGLLFSRFATSGRVSVLELLEEEARMVGG